MYLIFSLSAALGQTLAPAPVAVGGLAEHAIIAPRVAEEFIFELAPGVSSDAVGQAVLGAVGHGRVRMSFSGDRAFVVLAGLSDAESREAAKLPGVTRVVPNLLGTLEPISTGISSGSGSPRDSERTPGRGVEIYLLDDQVRVVHDDFRSLAWEPPARSVRNVFDARLGEGAGAQTAHGTQTASLAAGLRGGLARSASVLGIDVVRPTPTGGAPELAAVRSALRWVALNGVRPGVVSMGFEFPADVGLDADVEALEAAGFVVVTGSAPLRAAIPASTPTQSASQQQPSLTSIDCGLLAPATPGVVADPRSPYAYNPSPGKGTSAASLSGIIARYLGRHVGAAPSTVRAAVASAAACPRP